MLEEERAWIEDIYSEALAEGLEYGEKIGRNLYKDNKKSTSAAKTDSVKKVTLPKVDPKKVIQLNEGVNPKKNQKR